MLDGIVKQSSTQLSSKSFAELSTSSAEQSAIHRDDSTSRVTEIRSDEMEVDEAANGPAAAAQDLDSSLYADSLQRPPLWESSLWPPQSADLRVCGISGTQEKSGKGESEIFGTDVCLQTSISTDSEDEMVLEKSLPGEYRTD